MEAENNWISSVDLYEEIKDYCGLYYTLGRRIRQTLKETQDYVVVGSIKNGSGAKTKIVYKIRPDCAERLKQIVLGIRERRLKKQKDMGTGVYIIQYPWICKRIKIGWTTNFGKRYSDYNTYFAGEQKVLFFLQSTEQTDEKKVFELARSVGMIRQQNYEVFVYYTEEQIQDLINLIKNTYNNQNEENSSDSCSNISSGPFSNGSYEVEESKSEF